MQYLWSLFLGTEEVKSDWLCYCSSKYKTNLSMNSVEFQVVPIKGYKSLKKILYTLSEKKNQEKILIKKNKKNKNYVRIVSSDLPLGLRIINSNRKRETRNPFELNEYIDYVSAITNDRHILICAFMKIAYQYLTKVKWLNLSRLSLHSLRIRRFHSTPIIFPSSITPGNLVIYQIQSFLKRLGWSQYFISTICNGPQSFIFYGSRKHGLQRK